MTKENITQQEKKEENKSSQPTAKEKDIRMAIVAYIIFFIPLLTESKNNPFVKFHVKQGLVLFISGVIVGIINSILPWRLWIISRLFNLGLLVLMVIGIMNASKGEQKPLPVIGKFGEQFKF